MEVIHWRWIDSPMLDEGVESRFDGIHRIHWRRADSDGKVHDLFVVYISVNFRLGT